MRFRNLAVAAIAVAGLTASAVVSQAGGEHGHGHDHGHAQVGQKAPDFTLVDHAGNTHKLSDYAGKVVVLEWTNPECPFVVRHYNENTFIDMAKNHEDVVWLSIDSSYFVTAESASAWAKKEEIAYPILLDASGEVGHMYNARTTPHMFVIDTNGTLVYDGAIDDDPRGNAESRTNYVAAALKSVMNGEKVETATTKPYGCSVKYMKKDDKAKTS